MLPEDEDNPKMYVAYRMLPPGTHKYFYTVANNLTVAIDQPSCPNGDQNLPKTKEKKQTI
jgi:hypothetical protein